MLKLNLRQKVLLAFILLAVLPLALLVYNSSRNLESMENFLRRNTTEALDNIASRSLILRSEMVALQVSHFLKGVEDDLRELSFLPAEPSIYRKFFSQSSREVWYIEDGSEKRSELNLYNEISFISPQGKELIKIENGRISSDLRDVSDIKNTKYKSEDYFIKASKLPEGEVYVSRLEGFHVDKTSYTKELMGIKYRGHIRFAMPVYKDGVLEGVVCLALNHRHLMEFTQHITPAEEKYVVYPSYSSGNYSFMFDDEGWIITHPNYWDIRGVDKDGSQVPPYSENSTQEQVDKGQIPYNLNSAGFIHENYPSAAQDVADGVSGVVDVTNVGGAEKIMAYAPIFYDSGVYSEKGVFGGITIGSEVGRFHEPAVQTASIIQKEIKRFISTAWVMVSIIFLVVLVVSYRLSHGITLPLNQLSLATKKMETGEGFSYVDVDTGDEVGQLADSFNSMAKELEIRRAKLVQSLEELEKSRAELIKEESFKTTVFENIETGIVTVDEKNIVSFINSPARKMLEVSEDSVGSELCSLLSQKWPEIVTELEKALKGDDDKKWDGYLEMERKGRKMTFRLALLPLHYESLHGRILTVEDLTERVNMRIQMGRMERLSSMGRLSAGLAHEIRNPLTGVSIMLDDLHDRLIGRLDDQQLIQRSLQEMERLESLVNELLSFARTHSSELQINDIAAVVSDTVFLVQKQCERLKIELKTDVQPDIPHFPLDGVRLKQALLNILTNAIDSMPEGGKLDISAKSLNGCVYLSVKDTGAGIPEERISYIFEPFYTSKGEGSGLGLAITHNIISDHNGEIKVESRENEGTEFIMILPLK